MNWSRQRNGLVRGLLLSLTLIAVAACAVAQQKKPPAPAPSTPASKPLIAPKPAEAKPHEAPKTESKPAEAPKHEAKPATGATSGATHPGSTAEGKTGTSTTPHTSGVRTGSTPNPKTNGTASAAKPVGERVYAEPVVIARPGGGKSVTTASGHTTSFNPEGKKISLETKGGSKANFDHHGYIKSIHTRSGMTINHGAHGERHIESHGPDGGRIVGLGRGRGYVEHGYTRAGHPYVRRTYFSNGHSYAYAYRGYYWHGHPYYVYVPAYYYGRSYYGWVSDPWATPIAFDWGWGSAPWYGSYGYYFAPSPFYDSPSLWLTDYLMAANLQAAYEARAQANAAAAAADASAAAGPATITPEMKQLIAEEVRAQIAAEKAAADNPEPDAPASSAPTSAGKNGPDEVPSALGPFLKTFLVSTVLSEPMADGTECSLSPGDIITRIQDTPDANQSVMVVMVSSQRNDCAVGTQVAVPVTDLQNMHNDFRAKLSEGLGKLAENQGRNGIPSGPPADSKPNPNGQAQPDPTVEAALKAQQVEASQAESDVQQASIVIPDGD